MATENLEIIIGANTQDLQTGLNQASQSVTNFGNAVRTNLKPTADATNALSNLSRVAQDAPYGFMGIANNLNPLLESFQRLQSQTGSATTALKAMVAGLSGPAGIGVAIGVASSLIVAFGDEIDAFFTKLDEGSDESIRYKEALKGIGSEFTGAVQKVSDVKIAFEQYHKGILTGEQALRIYNAELGKSLGVKNDINDAEATFVNKSDAYVEASFKRALADEASKKSAEALLKAKILEETGGEKSGTLAKTLAFLVAPVLPKPLTDKLFNIYDKKKLENDITEYSDLSKAFNRIKEKSLNEAVELDKTAGVATSATEIKAIQEASKTAETELKNRNKTTQQLNNERLRQEIEVLEAEIAATNKWADSEMKTYNRMLDFWKKYGDTVKAVTNVSQFRDMLADQDKRREKEDKTPISERKIQVPEYILGMDAAIKKYDKDLADSIESSKKFAEVIAQDITGAFMTLFDALEQGKNPLQALGDYFTNLGKQIAAAAIEAAVFQGIMMLLNPASAGSFGGGFFEGFKKILGFAEGGIVSQPTIAMVGEGGQSEAIMPLNKLGNMMNSTFNAGAMSGGGTGGNGQFVLKGQDLILAINRSNASLNLRRGF